MAHDVFISYATEDLQTANAMCEALEHSGIKCWYAPRDVPFGVDYEEAIVDAINDSQLVVLILSSASNNSSHVRREIQNACAEQTARPILPVRIEDVPLNKALRYYLSSAQWLDASTSPLEPHLQRLIEQLRSRLPPPAAARDTGASTPDDQSSLRESFDIIEQLNNRRPYSDEKTFLKHNADERRPNPTREFSAWWLLHLATPSPNAMRCHQSLMKSIAGLLLTEDCTLYCRGGKPTSIRDFSLKGRRG